MGIDCDLILRHPSGSISLHSLGRWWDFVLNGFPPPKTYLPATDLKKWILENSNRFSENRPFYRGKVVGLLEAFPESLAMIADENSCELFKVQDIMPSRNLSDEESYLQPPGWWHSTAAHTP